MSESAQQPPISESYWVRQGRLLAGEYPRNIDDASSPRKIKALIDSGVNVFIDLTVGGEMKSYSHLLTCDTYHRFPITDLSVPRRKQQTRNILNCIDTHLEQGDVVYVHCWGGIGRTGTIIGCWLARHGNPGASALDELHRLWKACSKAKFKESPETRQQKEYVMDWRG